MNWARASGTNALRNVLDVVPPHQAEPSALPSGRSCGIIPRPRRPPITETPGHRTPSGSRKPMLPCPPCQPLRDGRPAQVPASRCACALIVPPHGQQHHDHQDGTLAARRDRSAQAAMRQRNAAPKSPDLTPSAAPYSHDGVGGRITRPGSLRITRPGYQAFWARATTIPAAGKRRLQRSAIHDAEGSACGVLREDSPYP